MPRPLSLEQLKIASPCTANWDEMIGDDVTRFCRGCEKHVYNLSEMTRAAAEAFVEASEGKKCVRFYRRADGTVLTSDCPEGAREKRRQLIQIGARVGGLGALLASAAAVPFLLVQKPAACALLTTTMGAPPPAFVHVPPPVLPQPLMGEAPMMGGLAPPERLMGKVAMPQPEPTIRR